MRERAAVPLLLANYLTETELAQQLHEPSVHLEARMAKLLADLHRRSP